MPRLWRSGQDYLPGALLQYGMQDESREQGES
jgi:hypothetical protein